MMHPLFAGFDERHDLRYVAEALGFACQIEELDDFDDDAPAYEDWEPNVPDGYRLAGKFENDEGCMALSVKPLTPLAEVLWLASAYCGARQHQHDSANGLIEIIAERMRQVQVEGWSCLHDDRYTNGELFAAAASYASISASQIESGREDEGPAFSTTAWPFPRDAWKPTTPKRNLAKAGALLLAESERQARKRLHDSLEEACK